MTNSFCFLAQLDGLNPLNPTAPVGKNTGLVFVDLLAIIGTGLALGLVLLLGARYYVRTRKRHRHHRHGEHTVDSTPAVRLNDGAAEAKDAPRHRRRRRHRREHRPRNPTLGETGGLPPSKPAPTPHPPL
jgi:hypothetical protein